MDKKEYFIRQIAKTNKKNYENYVVTKVLHSIDDLKLKFITQQPVSLSNGKRALTDLFFPQINLHIEVDELYHQHRIDEDKLRELDIISVTNHDIFRVDVSKSLEEINSRIFILAEEIRNRVKNKIADSSFIIWNIEKEYSADQYIQKGYIDVSDNVAFHTITEALRCFGLNCKCIRRSDTKHPIEKDVIVNFRRLYLNNNWDNKISSDGTIIEERYKGSQAWLKGKTNDNFVKDFLSNPEKFGRKRIIFGLVKDSLGKKLYRFKGYFEINEEKSWRENAIIWERKSTRVKTYEYSK